MTDYMQMKKSNFEMRMNDMRNALGELFSEYSDSLGYSEEADAERETLYNRYTDYLKEIEVTAEKFFNYYE